MYKFNMTSGRHNFYSEEYKIKVETELQKAAYKVAEWAWINES